MKIKPIISYSTLIATLIAFMFMGLSYKSFHCSFKVFNGLCFSDSRAEVLYRLGRPTDVLGPIEKGPWGKAPSVYSVDGSKNDQNTMPSGTQLDDYDEWFYDKPNGKDRFEVEFSVAGLMESVTFYSNTTYISAWGPIAGISNGDSEEKVLQLGEPSLISIKGVTKTIEFADIGLRLVLTKGRVYMAEVRHTKMKIFSTLFRFLHSFF